MGIVCRSGLSVREDAIAGADELGERLTLPDSTDLLMFFASGAHARRMGMIEDRLRERTGARCVVGVTGGGVIGGSLDRERETGLSAMCMRLPGVGVRPYWIESLPSGMSAGERAVAYAEQIGAGEDLRAALFFADPFSVPLVNLVPDLCAARMRRALSGGRVEPVGVIAGGLAAAGSKPGSNTLVCDGQVRQGGAMGVSLSGPLRVDAVVSQGCRPIGPRMVVTKARGNLILELGGMPAVHAVRQAVQELDEHERRLLGGGMLIGRVIDDTKRHLGLGDYLVRAVTGADEASGAIAVGDLVRAGQTVCLQLRDAKTAREDLGLLMDGQRLYERPAGALLFSCVSRGEAFYGTPGHDASTVANAFRPPVDGAASAKSGSAVEADAGIPLAGFFGDGEFGPIGDRVYHHEQTAVAVLLRDPDPA